MKNSYIIAIVELLERGLDAQAVLRGLKEVLTRKGHEKLHASILKGIVCEIAQREGSQPTRLIVADGRAMRIFQKDIESCIRAYNFNSAYEAEEDPSIVGGFILKNNTSALDRSYKQSLVRLYRSFS